MSENLENPVQELPAKKTRKSSLKWWLLGGCALIGLVVVAALALFVYFDPFGVVAMVFGGGELAAIVPDDVVVYVEVDLLALQSDDLQKIMEAFQDAAEDAQGEEGETEEGFLEENLGVTMDDISSWIGQYVGIAITELDYAQIQGNETAPMVFILQSRDKKAADAFITEVIDHREDEFDDEFDEFEFDRAIFFDNENDDEPLILGRYRNYVLIATDLDTLEDVLDLIKAGRRAKGTLADLDLYQRTLLKLPQDSMLTAYLNYEEYQNIYTDMMDEIGSGVSAGYELPDYDAGMGIAMELVDAGLQMTMATVYEDPEDLPWADVEFDMEDIEPQIPAMLPEETFIYLSGYTPEGYSETMLEMLGEDYLESLELLSDEIDIDPEALFNSIEGEAAFGVFTQESGILADVGGMPIGLSVIVGVNDEEEWARLFELMTDALASDGSALIEEFDLNGLNLESVSMDLGFFSYPFFVYGTGNDMALLTTEVENAEILVGDGDTLADSNDFQEVWEAFPEGDWPMLFIDVQALLEFIEDMNSLAMYDTEMNEAENGTAVLEPLTAIAATSSMYLYEDYNLTTVILFIDR